MKMEGIKYNQNCCITSPKIDDNNYANHNKNLAKNDAENIKDIKEILIDILSRTAKEIYSIFSEKRNPSNNDNSSNPHGGGLPNNVQNSKEILELLKSDQYKSLIKDEILTIIDKNSDKFCDNKIHNNVNNNANLPKNLIGENEFRAESLSNLSFTSSSSILSDKSSMVSVIKKKYCPNCDICLNSIPVEDKLKRREILNSVEEKSLTNSIDDNYQNKLVNCGRFLRSALSNIISKTYDQNYSPAFKERQEKMWIKQCSCRLSSTGNSPSEYSLLSKISNEAVNNKRNMAGGEKPVENSKTKFTSNSDKTNEKILRTVTKGFLESIAEALFKSNDETITTIDNIELLSFEVNKESECNIPELDPCLNCKVRDAKTSGIRKCSCVSSRESILGDKVTCFMKRTNDEQCYKTCYTDYPRTPNNSTPRYTEDNTGAFSGTNFTFPSRINIRNSYRTDENVTRRSEDPSQITLGANSKTEGYPAAIYDVFPIGKRSLMVKWKNAKSKDVGGFEVQLDGECRVRLHTSNHDSACIYGVDLNERHVVELFPIPRISPKSTEISGRGHPRSDSSACEDVLSWKPSVFIYNNTPRYS